MPEVWNHIPANFDISIGFNTKVLNARNMEWRYSNHDAHYSLDWSRHFVDQQAFNVETAFRKNALGLWFVPLFHDMTTSNALSASDTFTVDLGSRYDVGAMVIVAGAEGYETGVVQSFSGNQVVLTAPTSQSYSQGEAGKAYIAPAIECISTGMKRVISFNRTKITIGFVATSTMDAQIPAYQTYKGYPVLHNAVNKLGGYDGGISQKHTVLDDGFGNYAVAPAQTYQRSRNQITFNSVDRLDHRETLDFLFSAHGKDTPFWIPSYRRDLIVSAPAVSGSVVSFSPTIYNPADLVGAEIMLSTNQNKQFVKIQNAVLSGGNIIASISENLLFPVDEETKVSRLDLSRLDSNNITVGFRPTHNGPYMTTNIDVLEVKQ